MMVDISSDDSVMSLDLSCRSDGLLVGFGSRKSPEHLMEEQREREREQQEQHPQTSALLGSNSSSSSQQQRRKATWVRLFRRPSSSIVEETSLLQHSLTAGDAMYDGDEDDDARYSRSGDDDYEDGYGMLKESPYCDRHKFPSPQKAEPPVNVTMTKFRDSTNTTTRSNSYRDGRPNSFHSNSNQQQQQQPPQWQKSQSVSDLKGRNRSNHNHNNNNSLQGFGNCDPRKEAAATNDGFGTFFRRLYDRQQQEERQSMRIATEATMDEANTSWTDNFGRAAAVLLAPELCVDPDEDLDRLAMYRSVGTGEDDDEEEEEERAWNESKPNEIALWKTEVQRLKGYIDKLEHELKSKDMEAMSWKARAKELEQQVRTLSGRGDNEDSSASNQDCNEEDNDDDDDEEEEEEDIKVVEGDLLGMANQDNTTKPVEVSSLSSAIDGNVETSKQATEASLSTAVQTNNQQQPASTTVSVNDPATAKNHLPVFDPLNEQQQQQQQVTDDLLTLMEGRGSFGFTPLDATPTISALITTSS